LIINPRDMQFAHFARMLCADLIRADPSYWQQLIARRAYDLVWHVLSRVEPDALAYQPLANVMCVVPDVDAWPDEGEARFNAWLSTQPDPADVARALVPWRRRTAIHSGD